MSGKFGYGVGAYDLFCMFWKTRGCLREMNHFFNEWQVLSELELVGEGELYPPYKKFGTLFQNCLHIYYSLLVCPHYEDVWQTEREVWNEVVCFLLYWGLLTVVDGRFQTVEPPKDNPVFVMEDWEWQCESPHKLGVYVDGTQYAIEIHQSWERLFETDEGFIALIKTLKSAPKVVADLLVYGADELYAPLKNRMISDLLEFEPVSVSSDLCLCLQVYLRESEDEERLILGNFGVQILKKFDLRTFGLLGYCDPIPGLYSRLSLYPDVWQVLDNIIEAMEWEAAEIIVAQPSDDQAEVYLWCILNGAQLSAGISFGQEDEYSDDEDDLQGSVF